MKRDEKEALVWLAGALGIVSIVAGIFTPFEFVYALVIAFFFFVLSGFLKKYFGIEKKK